MSCKILSGKPTYTDLDGSDGYREQMRCMRAQVEDDRNAGRHGISKAASGSEHELQRGEGNKIMDELSTVGSKSRDGRNIYYLHTCHQRTHESVGLTADPVFMRSCPSTGHIRCALLVNQPK